MARAASRARAVLPLLASLGAACADVRSLAPAVRDADAIEQPSLVGRWIVPDTTRVDIRRVPGAAPRYAIEIRDLTAGRDTTADGSRADSVGRFEGRVGRIGRMLVLEVTPDGDADTTLEKAFQSYSPLIITAYMVLPMELRGDELQLGTLRADSLRAFIRRGTCPTPILADSSRSARSTLLTGSSAEVRSALECASRQPGFADTLLVLRRAAPR